MTVTPQEILQLLSIAKDKKDITLLSVITISSNLFPVLRTIYDNKIHPRTMENA